jgi:uncharacterized protein YcaQ
MTAAAAIGAGSRAQISSAEARRLAVYASIGPCRPSSDAVLKSTGLLQLDPLSRVDKAHRLTCLARMDASARAADIDAPLWQDGQAAAFETWVHAVCLVPAADWPLLRIARDNIRRGTGGPPRPLLDEVIALVRSYPDGATISDIEHPGHRTSGWEWSERKHAVEHMLRSGDLVCTARRGSKRVYDLPQRRIPKRYLAETGRSTEELLASIAAKAIGAMAIATAGDVARYYNISTKQAELGLGGAGLRQVTVQGWKAPAWIDPATSGPPDTTRDPVLIGPFDNLIWDRQRTRRVFQFDYTFEAYKPKQKRTYGYYVMALLDNGELTGRADMRGDLDQVTVLASYPEPGTDPAQFVASLESARARLQHQLTKS